MPSTSTDRIAGLSTSVAVKAPVKAISSANLTLSGEQTVNGVAVVPGDRVLVKDQTDATENGIYDVATGVWSRSADFDGSRDVVKGTLVVSNGSTTIYYRVTTSDPIVIGTSEIAFEVVSGAVTQSSIGAALYPQTAAELAAGVTPSSYAYPPGDVRRYGADPTGVSDSTAAIQAAVDAAYAGGPEVAIPPGTFLVTSISKQWSGGSTTVNIRGAGKMATVLQKTGAGTDPVFNFSSDGVNILTYSDISDLKIVGSAKGHDGVRLTNCARLSLRNLRIESCDVGVSNLGSILVAVYDCNLNGNNIGYKCRKSGAIYANLVNFYNGTMSGNSSFGVDLGEAVGVNFYGTEIALNGTSGNTATGGVILRSTLDDESGFSQIAFNQCWMESNDGMAFRAEDCAGLYLTVRDLTLLGSESGNAMTIGVVRDVTLDNVVAPSTNDTITLAATNSTVIGGYAYTLTDTSTHQTHIAHTSFFGQRRNRVLGTSPRWYFSETDQAADEKLWGVRVNSKVFDISAFNDAENSARAGLSITRGTGEAISRVDLGNSTDKPQARAYGPLAITDGIAAPSTASGYALIYVDESDGDLKVKFGDGTVKTIATDT